MVGRTIGKYRILAQIGRGGMGTVYKAVDETLDRPVAIKVLNGDVLQQESIERFRREAMTLAKLNHARIGAIHELTRDGHDLLMVMEFLEGETCEHLIERSGALAVSRAVQICAQALEALQYAHGAGIVHRDLKPANIIISPSGDVKLMDFGIARVQGSEHLTSHGFMVGTPAYMSPEQVRGEEVDPRMDLYAIAVVLYRLLTNHLPFQGDTAIAMIHSQLSNQPTPAKEFRGDLPEWVQSVLTRGLAKAKAERFQTASEFRAALENGVTGRMPIVAPTHDDLDITVGPMLTPPAMRVPSATASGRQAIPPPPASGQRPVVTTPSGNVRIPTVSAPIPTGSAPMPAAPMSTSTGHAPLPAATPVPPMPPARPEATVTLRAPHLAGAAVLVVLLIIGVTILAVLALQRDGGTPTPGTASAPASATSAPVTPDSTAPATTPSPNATGAASAAATVSTPAAPAPASTPAAPAATPAATRPAPAETGTASAAGPTAGRGPDATAARSEAGRRGSAPAPAPAPATNATAPSATTATPATTATAAAGAVPKPTPAAADAPTENFGVVRTVLADGSRSREVESLLSLEPSIVITRNRNDGSVVKWLSYRDIVAATYNRARRPKGQSVPGAVAVPENFAGGGVFGSARHWLTLQTASEFIVLRLEDRNVIGVLNGIEARTGLKVVRNQDD